MAPSCFHCPASHLSSPLVSLMLKHLSLMESSCFCLLRLLSTVFYGLSTIHVAVAVSYFGSLPRPFGLHGCKDLPSSSFSCSTLLSCLLLAAVLGHSFTNDPLCASTLSRVLMLSLWSTNRFLKIAGTGVI